MQNHSPQIELLDTSLRGIRIHTFEKECVDFHWHFHQEVELLWIEKGEGILHAGRALWPYKAGQFILLGSNLPHAFGSDPSQRTGAKWTVLHFRPSLWGDAFWQLPENKRIQSLIKRAECGYVYTGKIAQKSMEIVQRMQTRSPRDMPLARLLDLLQMLACDGGPHPLNTQSAEPHTTSSTDPRLLQILDRLESTFRDPTLTQAEVARWIHMTPQAFCRYFRRQSGRNFQHYLNELRIAHACANLLSTNKAVAEIAYESGFNNLSNFNRHFRAYTSYTPRTYRQNKGGLHQAGTTIPPSQ